MAKVVSKKTRERSKERDKKKTRREPEFTCLTSGGNTACPKFALTRSANAGTKSFKLVSEL